MINLPIRQRLVQPLWVEVVADVELGVFASNHPADLGEVQVDLMHDLYLFQS